jgi:dihydrodipicolinate synthase/N-acetylneuraminate lyase
MPTLTRREYLWTLGAVALVSRIPRLTAAAPTTAPKSMAGPFIILNTPFTAAGDVDWADFTREVEFVDRAGCQGIVWPQGSSSVATLTKDERMRGMEVLAKAVEGKRIALMLGVQGKDIAEMREYATRADALNPDAVIAMPPTTGTSMDDYRAYFRALAAITKRPVFVQTSGGARDLPPTTDLIVELAREFPNFGYVKEESQPVVARMKAEIAARPAMKGVFGASFAEGWLYELRLGLDGVITGSGMYADVLARIWDAHTHGRPDEARDAYSKFLLMRNLEEQIPGTGLYIMKKRGIFKTTVRRTTAPSAGTPPKLSEFKPSPVELEEIEYRFAALKPYLVSGT